MVSAPFNLPADVNHDDLHSTLAVNPPCLPFSYVLLDCFTGRSWGTKKNRNSLLRAKRAQDIRIFHLQGVHYSLGIYLPCGLQNDSISSGGALNTSNYGLSSLSWLTADMVHHRDKSPESKPGYKMHCTDKPNFKHQNTQANRLWLRLPALAFRELKVQTAQTQQKGTVDVAFAQASGPCATPREESGHYYQTAERLSG